jgi:hypothetical protein
MRTPNTPHITRRDDAIFRQRINHKQQQKISTINHEHKQNMTKQSVAKNLIGGGKKRTAFSFCFLPRQFPAGCSLHFHRFPLARVQNRHASSTATAMTAAHLGGFTT